MENWLEKSKGVVWEDFQKAVEEVWGRLEWPGPDGDNRDEGD